MQISWYPLQLFVRRLELVIPLGVSIALAGATIIWMAVAVRHIKEPVFLHYSIELGVDAAGPRWEAFLLPVFLFIATCAFAVLTNALILPRRQFAIFVAYSTPVFALFGTWCVFLLLRANGAA